MIKFLTSICLLVCCVAAVGQTPPDTKAKWTRIEDEKAKVSILFPADFLIDNEIEKQSFAAPIIGPSFIETIEKPKIMGFRKSVVMSWSVHRLSSSEAKKHLRFYVGDEVPKEQFQDFQVGDFVGRIVTRDTENRKSIRIAFARKDKIFVVDAAAKKEDAAIFHKFIKSLMIDGNLLFKTGTPEAADSAAPVVSAATLATSPEILAALNQKPEKFVENVVKGVPIIVNEKAAERDYSRPMIILRQPYAAFYNVARNNRHVSGTIRLNVTYLATGKIGKIEIISQMPDGLTDAAVKAAQNVKFLPAEIDGKKVDVTQPREYSFNLGFY